MVRGRATVAVVVAIVVAGLLVPSVEALPSGSDAVLTSGGLEAAATDSGVRITPASRGWNIEMRLAGVGRGEHLDDQVPLSLSSSPDGVDVAFPQGVGEWYDRHPDGIEQGFTVPARPPGAGDLTLSVSLHTDLLALERDDEIVFLDIAGAPRASYSDLHVYDATGAELPSRMKLDDDRILLTADDTDATYPVTVDPLVAVSQGKLTPVNESSHDQFGFSVSVSGDTAVVGAHLDDDLGTDSGSAYVFTRTGSTWTEQQQLLASDGGAANRFGTSVSVDGDTAVIGAYLDDDNGVGSGSAYVFTRDGTTWTEQEKLVASDATVSDLFGISVSVSVDTAIVGSFGDDDSGAGSGSAYVFTRSGTDWIEQQKILASDGASGDSFGISISVSGDTAVVGAYLDDDQGSSSGSAYVFALDGTNWIEQQKLLAPDGAAGDRFGISVAVSGDTAVVGANLDDDRGSSSGSAYAFVRDGTTWAPQQKLLPSDGAAGDAFGISVAVFGDTAVVGANLDDDLGSSSGTAYVFTFDGTDWIEQQKLLASDGASGDRLGVSVSVSGDTAVVGSALDTDNGAASGSASVFVRSGSAWSQEQKLLSSAGGAPDDHFGFSIAVSGDTAVIGAPLNDDDGLHSGSVFVFTRSGSTWSQQQKLLASDGFGGDRFGGSVSVSGDTAVVGAAFDDDNGGDSGAAYVFTRSGGAWTEQQKLLASDGTAADLFGISVSIDDDTAVVGSYLDDDNGLSSGSAYVFTRSASNWTQEHKLVASDGATGERFGSSVSLSGDAAVVGSPFDDDNGSSSGSAYVFIRSGSSWTQQHKLVASDAAASEGFGSSVSVSEDTAVVGAPFHNGVAVDSGSAYVFTRSGSNWTQQQKLVASDGADSDRFGGSVSLSGDTAVVGAHLDDDNGADSGSAYVFTRSGDTWTQRQKALAPDGAPNDHFGVSVSVSGDTAVVGADLDDDNGPNSGSAYGFFLSRPPAAADDDYSTPEGTTLTGSNVLDNDTDPDGHPLTASLMTEPSHGVLSLDGDGSFTYTPDPGFNGADSFTYEACDPAPLCDAATATIIVTEVDHAPTAVDDVASTPQYEEVAIPVLDNDTDADGDPIGLTMFTQPANGTVAGGAGAVLTYAPNPAFSGTDSFTYTITDGRATDTATVTVTVGGCPDGSEESGPISMTVDSLEGGVAAANPGLARQLHAVNCALIVHNGL